MAREMERDRVVLFYTYIPQFYYSERPPTTITSAVLQANASHLEAETLDLCSMRDKSEVKDVVARHLAGKEANALFKDKAETRI